MSRFMQARRLSPGPFGSPAASRVAQPACVLLLLLAATAPARAASQTDSLSACGSRATFESELKKRLGDDVPLDNVSFTISARGSRYHLRVQVDGQLRELDDASCAELFRAAVVVAVAMLMHEEPPDSVTSQPAPADRHDQTSPRVWPRFSVGAGAGLDVASLRKPTLAIELEGKTLFRYWGLAVGLRYLTPVEIRDEQDKGVRMQAFGAGVTGIFRPSEAWEARLGFAAQRLMGRGVGTTPQDGRAWAAGPTLGLGVVPLRHGAWWAGLGAESQLNLLRASFSIQHYRDVFTMPWLSGSAFVRLGVIW